MEIRYRAWAKYGEMLYNIQNHIGNDSWAFGNIIKSNDFIVMQSTGIFDINKQEIYVGDVVRIWFDKAQKYIIMEVVCQNLGNLNITKASLPLYNLYGEEKPYRDYPHDYEIIGNIFEHPNLLL